MQDYSYNQQQKDNQFIFKTHSVRSNFQKKVLSIVGIQLLSTAIICTILQSLDPQQKLSIILLPISSISALVSMLCLSCSRKMARKVPTNYILLLVLTVSESIILNSILYDYSLQVIGQAMLVTALGVGLLGCIALFSKTEIGTSKFFFYFTIGKLLLFIVGLFFFNIDSLVYGIISSITFSIYLIIDLQMLMENKKLQLSIDDYVFGAMQIYIDIIQLFIKVLEFFGKDDKKSKKKNQLN